MLDRTRRALLIAAILMLLSLVVFGEFREPTRFMHTLQKLAHPMTFAAVALLLLMLRRDSGPRRLGTYVWAFGLAVLGAAATEIAQAYVHRDPSVLDVLRDALGAGTALAGFATVLPGADARGRGAGRLLGLIATVAGLAIIAAPMAICLAAYARRDLEYPVIAEFCSPLDWYFLRGGGALLQAVRADRPSASPCGNVLRVEFGTERYAGVHLEEPYPDWRKARTLVLDLANPGELDLSLVVRVHDRAHSQQYRDRFNREFTLRAHARLEIAIPLAEVEHAPAGRLMDLARIAGLAVFRDRGTQIGSFEIERIALRR